MMDFAQLLTCLYVNFADFDVTLLPKEITFTLVPEECWVATADGEVDNDWL